MFSSDTLLPVVVVGAGRVGQAVARRLFNSGNYSVRLADPHYEVIDKAKSLGATAFYLSPADYEKQLQLALKGAFAVVCATPDFVTRDIAAATLGTGCHYLDVSENITTQRHIQNLALSASSAYVTGCGLAPGWITTWVADWVKKSGPLSCITAYVGVLPNEKINRLGYANMWGIDGLLYEYSAPCLALRDGKPILLEPLSELEKLQLADESFEAFNTAGTLDDLVERMKGNVKSLQFKTIRYPGHWDLMQFLLYDLGLKNKPQILKNLLLNGLPTIVKDRIVVCIEVQQEGQSAERQRQVFQWRPSIEPTGPYSESAISGSCAAHVCAMIDWLRDFPGVPRGVINHADLSLSQLNKSSFMNEFVPSEEVIF